MSRDTQLRKLYTQGLPTLESEDPAPRDVARWLIQLENWARVNSRHDTMFRRLAVPHDAEQAVILQQKQEESLRLLIAAIQSKTITLDLTSRTFTHARDAIDGIRNRWLGGRTEQQVLMRELPTLRYQEGMSIIAYQAEFTSMVLAIMPAIDSQAACDMFADSMPERYDALPALADANPGRNSIHGDEPASFRALIDEYCKHALRICNRGRARIRTERAEATDALATQEADGNGAANFTGQDRWTGDNLMQVNAGNDEDERFDSMCSAIEALANTVARWRPRDNRNQRDTRNGRDPGM